MTMAEAPVLIVDESVEHQTLRRQGNEVVVGGRFASGGLVDALANGVVFEFQRGVHIAVGLAECEAAEVALKSCHRAKHAAF